MHFWLSVGRSNECIFGSGFKARFGFCWRFVHALLNAFGGSKFEGVIWKKCGGRSFTLDLDLE